MSFESTTSSLSRPVQGGATGEKDQGRPGSRGSARSGRSGAHRSDSPRGVVHEAGDDRLPTKFRSLLNVAMDRLDKRHPEILLDTDVLRRGTLYSPALDEVLKPHARPLQELYSKYAGQRGNGAAMALATTSVSVGSQSSFSIQDWLRNKPAPRFVMFQFFRVADLSLIHI